MSNLPLQNLRLSQHDIDALVRIFHKYFLKKDALWLFGSRTNPAKKGGDIDLYIETHAKSIEKAIQMKADFIWDLEQAIGEQKIDVVLNMLHFPYPLPIHDIAKSEGVRIV